jgi:hypothetical protein
MHDMGQFLIHDGNIAASGITSPAGKGAGKLTEITVIIPMEIKNLRLCAHIDSDEPILLAEFGNGFCDGLDNLNLTHFARSFNAIFYQFSLRLSPRIAVFAFRRISASIRSARHLFR